MLQTRVFANTRKDDNNYYTQLGKLLRAMTSEQQFVLYENTAQNMGDSTIQLKHHHINNTSQADPDYSAGIDTAIGINLEGRDTKVMINKCLKYPLFPVNQNSIRKTLIQM